MSRARPRRRSRSEAASPAHRGNGAHPARIYRELKSNGARFWALFDSGSRRTYVTKAAAVHFGIRRLAKSVKRALAGRTHTITQFCALGATVEGYAITADALVIDHLFPDEQGRPIDILLGMETMESWGIGLDNAHKQLDFRFYAQEAYEG